jgi:glycosyltransferase involved in cell wall biosynthesis
MLGARFYGSHSLDTYQQTLETLSQKLEANGVQVRRPGFVSRLALPRVLARADVHVVPSRWEDPCPLTVLEGMATGQATVGASCGGVPELIGSEGFLFERDDVEGLEARLRVLFENPGLRHSYGKRARERALQRPWTKVFGELVEAVNL